MKFYPFGTVILKKNSLIFVKIFISVEMSETERVIKYNMFNRKINELKDRKSINSFQRLGVGAACFSK